MAGSEPSHILFLIANTTLLFCIAIPLASSLSFDLNSFSPNGDDNITYERASFANGPIQLTANQQDLDNLASIGRATYSNPLQLHDKASGNVTDFSTHFTFIINSQGSYSYSDGLAFFLAPVGSKIPANSTNGGCLGLANDTQWSNSTDNPFVAVEFDTYINHDWDPDNVGEHVGININSLESVKIAKWPSRINIVEGRENEAWISYDSSLKNLSVVFTTSNKTVKRQLSYIVDLSEYLPEMVRFGFSAATGNKSALHTISSWNFSSTLDIKSPGDPVVVAPSPDSNPKVPNASKSRAAVLAGVVVGGSILLGGLMGLVLFVVRKKRERGKPEVDFVFDMDDEFEKGTGPKKFSYAELARATNNFLPQEKLGEGGFGGVYRGFLKELNSYIAVKRVSRESRQGIKEYASEVKIISRLRHRNLVQLLGWCHEKGELLLVYEFMSNGSLDFHLFKGKSLLTWEMRYKIAQGLASALLYLHEEWEQCVVHRDIKSSNVMLDSNFNAKLGDFGLARFVDHEKGLETTILAGTMGYMAPECLTTGQASKESDVYSFGVVALEIACGRKPIEPMAKRDMVRMVEWVWELYGTGTLLEAADPNLSADFDEQEMKQLMIVGLWCAHPDSTLRPSIRQAIHILKFEAPLPNLPRKMPVATFSTPANTPSPHDGDVISETGHIRHSSGYSNVSGSSMSHSSSFV